jgi:hypothetical protein
VRDAGPYGRIGLVTAVLWGPVCLPAKWTGDNGGTTYQGVTKDAVKTVVLLPNEQQLSAPGTRLPVNYGTGKSGTIKDALEDSLAVYKHFFSANTYGRDVQLSYVTSSGSDEAAQRADAIAVKDTKPFVVLDMAGSLEVFDSQIAAAKVPVFSLYTTVADSLKQAPYLWGQQDNAAAMINGAEFVGKQVARKKAAYAGDDSMHGTTRKFGLVASDALDSSYFTDTLSKYKVKIPPETTITYTGSTSATGDAASAQTQAPTAISKLKDAGVTTVLLLADPAMVSAMTTQATAQDYHPEWVYLGTGNIDFPLLARGYDQSQWAHAFGLSNVFPGTIAATTSPSLVQWYWGNQGTYDVNTANAVNWLMLGVMYAGPKLTPQTLKQGFFSVPASGGSAVANPELASRSVRSGYGKGANGLPYEEYTRGNKDFSATWWDPGTVGPPTLGFPGGQGTGWYLNDAARYIAGKWPTKPMTFFDRSQALYQFTAPDPSQAVIACTGCPSETGQGTPPSS